MNSWMVSFNSLQHLIFVLIAEYVFLVYKKADEDNKPHSNRVDCTPDTPPKDGKVCRVDVSSAKFGACTKSNQYGYSKGSPCVFLKLNKVCHVLSFGRPFLMNKC